MSDIKVKFADLRVSERQYIQAVTDVLESGRFIGGPEVDEFSKRWAQYCDVERCVPVASGSTALTVAIRGVGRRGDKVVVPAFTFAATILSVIEAGFTPLYCDVTEDGLLNWDQVERLIDEHGVQGIVPVHLYGQYTRVPEALRTKVWVVEDSCQAHGLLGGGNGVALQGEAACYSFYPSKNLGAVGDAGAIVTDNKALSDWAAAYVNYGDPPGTKYQHLLPGTNARMDAIQAAYLNMQLGQLGENNTIRAKVAEQYKNCQVLTVATAKPNVWHLYPILAANPDELICMLLQEYGVEAGRHYPYTLDQLLPGLHDSPCPVAERLARHIVTLPIGPHMTLADARYVADSLKQAAQLDDDEGMWRLK